MNIHFSYIYSKSHIEKYFTDLKVTGKYCLISREQMIYKDDKIDLCNGKKYLPWTELTVKEVTVFKAIAIGEGDGTQMP